MIKKVINRILRFFFEVKENPDRNLDDIKSILVIRQHNQLGDLLASSTIFRALKEKYPSSELNVVVSRDNYAAVTNNHYIDKIFIFNKFKIYYPSYLGSLLKLLHRRYDLAIVPCTVSISFTSNLLARLAKAKSRIGVKNLNGMENKYCYFFDRQIELDWRTHPDRNVSDFCLDILRPFGISTNDYKPDLKIEDRHYKVAQEFLTNTGLVKNRTIIGMHIGAGKPPNRWSVKKFIELASKLIKQFNAGIYLTGTAADKEVINYFVDNASFSASLFIGKEIPEVAALISICTLFITNDTGVMHVAGSTDTPQVSIFGPTNPFNWAPIGSNKVFIRNSELIEDITVDEVFEICSNLIQLKLTD